MSLANSVTAPLTCSWPCSPFKLTGQVLQTCNLATERSKHNSAVKQSADEDSTFPCSWEQLYLKKNSSQCKHCKLFISRVLLRKSICALYPYKHSIKYNGKHLILVLEVIFHSETTSVIAQNPNILLQPLRTTWNQAAWRQLQLKLLGKKETKTSQTSSMQQRKRIWWFTVRLPGGSLPGLEGLWKD